MTRPALVKQKQAQRFPAPSRTARKRWLVYTAIVLCVGGLLSHYVGRHANAVQAALSSPLPQWQRLPTQSLVDRSAAGLHHDFEKHLPLTKVVGHSPGTTASLRVCPEKGSIAKRKHQCADYR